MKSKKTAILTSVLTIFSLLGVMLLQLVVRINAIKNNYTLYTCIFIVIMGLIITFAYVFRDKGRKKKHSSYNRPMLISWIAMCLVMLFSDIVVFKQYWFLSLILLLLFTGLFIILGRYSANKRDRLWKLFAYAVEIAFAAATVFCILFRPYTAGIRYSGLSANPNVYAMFLITVWICVITRFDIIIEKKLPVIRAVIPGIEFGTALFFLYLTGARTSFVSIFAVTLIWVLFRIHYSRKDDKPVLKYAVMTMGGAIPAFILSYILLSVIPGVIGHPVSFERDKMYTAIDNEPHTCLFTEHDYDTTVPDFNNTFDSFTGLQPVLCCAQIYTSAELESESSLLNRILHAFSDSSSMDSLFNGRIAIFKGYTEKLNNTGHKKYNKMINGENVVHAHNNIIQMAYSYGRPAALMYIIVTVLAIIYSIRLYISCRGKRTTAVLPMLIVLAFTITSMTECVLIPMQSLLAFAFYLAVGELINTTYDYKSKD